jgi:adenylate cyclase
MAPDGASAEKPQAILPDAAVLPGATPAWIRPLADRLRDIALQPVAAGLLALLLTILAMLALREVGAFAPLELLAYYKLVVLRSHGPGVESRVVQIEIGEDDLERYHWPLTDGILANIIERLRDADPRAIGIDIFRPTPIGPGTEALDREIADTPQLVWADRFREGAWEGIPAPQAAVAADRVGFSDLVLDGSGVARRALLYLSDADHWETALSLKLALLYLAPEGIAPVADQDQSMRLGAVSLPPLDSDLGGYDEIDARGYQIMREFRPPTKLQSFPLRALLQGTVPADQLANRVVIVGVVADSVKDFVITPLDVRSGVGTPGVTLQGLFTAELLNHALDGVVPTRPLKRTAETGIIVLIMLCGGIAGLVARRPLHLTLVIMFGAVLLVIACYIALLHSLWLPTAEIAIGWSAALLFSTIGAAFADRAQRALLMRLFSIYAAAPIAQDLWHRRGEFTAHGNPLALRLTCTVLASDINDFTTVSESNDPAVVAHWINLYMDAMTSLVGKHGGIVEHFAGDGIIAVWGVPIARQNAREIEADAVAATGCALDMAEALRALNVRYRGESLPEMRVAIGIYSGDLIGCSIGSAERKQYSTIGDTPNTAARLVGVAKDHMKAEGTHVDCRIVVGEATLALLHDSFATRPLGSFPLKGKSRPVQCHVVDGVTGTGAP